MKDKRKTSKEIAISLPSPYNFSSHKTERSAVAIIMHWMREIIEKNNIDLGLPDVETSGTDRKMPDTVIYESRRSQNVLCVIEAKPPYYDIFDERDLKEPAREKATKRKAKYFCITNFKTFIWYKTENVNALKPEEEQIIEKYHLSEIENLDEIEQTRFSEKIKKALEDFLIKLFAVSTGKEPEPKQAIDEFLIFRLQEKIKFLSKHYTNIIEDQIHKDHTFYKKLKNWFLDQGWSFTKQIQDYDKAARQTAYLLVNKILFYNLLQAKRPQELDPLEIPKSLTKGELLKKTLQNYFDDVLKIDYETIFTTDFIDTIAFPDEKEVVNQIKELVNVLKRYDFSKLGYDIVGKIFESLIPGEERHILGQYFTNSDVVDLILNFCLHHENDKIIDPSCGAGTFLVRAYQHKKILNQRLEHEKILETLWGVDIAKFPAHLATINLAINDLASDKNYPNIIHDDFFNLKAGSEGFDLEKWRNSKAKTLTLHDRDIIYPRWFDAIVGNPPYTRQEEIPDIGTEKEKIIESALSNGNNKIADISKRAGIHAYFFVHGTKFLREGGYFGFIVSNSWLDVEYGKGLQEFFLKNYKIISIIESKVERWFEDADVNTCIVILQKCNNEKERNENIVRFVYLKKPLRNFIPPANDMWEKQIERINAIDKLKRTILAHNHFYENDELRIFPITQRELWKEGYDKEEKKFVGAKWGKYIRAPEILFKILKKGKDKFAPLKNFANIRFGIKTGANEFFYLTDEKIKQRGIEKKFLQPVIFSLKEIKGYKIDKEALKYKVIICDKPKEKLTGTNLLKYINWGEKQNYHKRPTCASRSPQPWYSLGTGWEYAPLIFPAKVGERMPVFLNENVFEDKKLYGIIPKKPNEKLLLAALLNSTLTRFFIEFTCRQLTGSQAIADIDVIVVQNLLIPNPKVLSTKVKKNLIEKFNNLCKSYAESIFVEIAPNPEDITLDKIKIERRELDKIIMEEILGLSDNEQLEVYCAVVDLVKSRIEKAKNSENKNNTKLEINIEQLKNSIINQIEEM
ncbi:MAG: N-6 DNA methylase [Melioribacteraceae bacterium]